MQFYDMDFFKNDAMDLKGQFYNLSFDYLHINFKHFYNSFKIKHWLELEMRFGTE